MTEAPSNILKDYPINGVSGCHGWGQAARTQPLSTVVTNDAASAVAIDAPSDVGVVDGWNNDAHLPRTAGRQRGGQGDLIGLGRD